jgi:hypothetical protein
MLNILAYSDTVLHHAMAENDAQTNLMLKPFQQAIAP